MMKNWFDRLTNRERIILIAGCIIIGVIFVYILLWSPIFKAASQAHHQAQTQARLLQWMQNANRRIQLARTNGIEISSTQTPILLSSVESTFASCHLTQYIQSVQQPRHNEMTLILHEAPFDTFIHCIYSLIQHEGVTTKHLKVSATSIQGLVNIEITLIQ